MKAIVKALYTEPIIFLGAVQAAVTVLAAEHVITGWIPLATLAVIAALQRRLVSPKGE